MYMVAEQFEDGRITEVEANHKIWHLLLAAWIPQMVVTYEILSTIEQCWMAEEDEAA
jgi:hypothetical protein